MGAFTPVNFAFGNEGERSYTARALDQLLESPAEEIAPSPELPRLLSTELSPQSRVSTTSTPFIDFSKFEMGAYGGIVFYSSDFDADPALVGGITARLPIPGIPLGEWGIWGQAFISYVKRDLPFYYDDKSGIWYGAAVGGDYTFFHNGPVFLRGQVGILYAYWNGVNGLDNGVGIVGGMQLGWYWIKHNNNATMNITPQFTYDGSSWMGFITVGFSVDF